jgi:transcription initiation factor IIE alpha subunit
MDDGRKICAEVHLCLEQLKPKAEMEEKNPFFNCCSCRRQYQLHTSTFILVYIWLYIYRQA